MSMIKYAAAGAAGYFLHAAIKKREESKVYRPTPVDEKIDPSLSDVLIEHYANKFSNKIANFIFPEGGIPRPRRYSTSYVPGHKN